MSAAAASTFFSSTQSAAPSAALDSTSLITTAPGAGAATASNARAAASAPAGARHAVFILELPRGHWAERLVYQSFCALGGFSPAGRGVADDVLAPVLVRQLDRADPLPAPRTGPRRGEQRPLPADVAERQLRLARRRLGPGR